MRLLGGLTALAILAAMPAQAETLDNAGVVMLTAAGLGDEAIIAKIKASQPAYELSTAQIIDLKAKGVSGPVIAAMLAAANPVAAAPAMSVDSPDPAVPHPAGVYLLADWLPEAKMMRIDATVSNQAKTGGILGYALTGGIASLSVKASIQNETARTQSPNAKPVFFFFFDESQGAANGQWLSGTAATVTSPNEFTLIRLTPKKGRREARVGSVNIGGAKSGVMDSDRLSFHYDLVRPGVFKATPDNALPKGEYGFIYSIQGSGAPAGGALTARIFDFTVK